MRTAALTALVVTAIGGGYAIAATSGSGAIRACVSKHTGAVRIVSRSRCHKGERLLRWNQLGRRGPVGSTGPQGLPGLQGNPGTLKAFEAYRTPATAANIAPGATGSAVATLSNVPAGAYTVSGYVQLDNHTDNVAADLITCVLTAGSVSVSDYTNFNGGASPLAATIPLELTQTLTAPTSVSISCKKSGSGSAFIENAELIATQVASQSRTQAG